MTETDYAITVRPPRANPDLLGQEAAERALIAAVAGGRMPHAWLISGPGGVGKATLAYRLARFLYVGASNQASSLATDPNSGVFHRVASGGHADLLTVERRINEDTGRMRKDISVDDVRRIEPFLRLTAAEGGWRIVIVDGAEDMNRAGQNAILKILEEPPKGALLLLLTERPSALLPTIRSRCRALHLPSLDDAILDRLIVDAVPEMSEADRGRLRALAIGSIGRALDIARHDGVALLSQFLGAAGAQPVDWPVAHALGDRLGAATAEDSYHSFARLLVDWLSRAARDLASGPASARPRLMPGEEALIVRLGGAGRLERAVEVWEKVSHLFARSDSANLDRRVTVISAMDMVGAALN